MQQIRDIHNSDLFGIVIETGCGAAITSKLTSVEGATKTLYFAKIPYSKEYEERLYGTFPRSVSREFVERALDSELNLLSPGEKRKINFAIVTSWQLGANPGEITHGWFNVWFNDNQYKIHYTFPKQQGQPLRSLLLDEIGNIGIGLIHSLIGESAGIEDRMSRVPTDAIPDISVTNDHDWGVVAMKRLENSTGDYFLTFDSNGPMRFEELMRMSDQFIVNKGSFNPLHHGHVQMMRHARHTQGMHSRAVPVFLISTYRYDKPHISWEELRPRIDAIISQGYHVLVCKQPLFYNTFKMLRMNAGKQKKFFFTIGSDTLNRIYQTDLEETVDQDHPEPSPFMARTKIEGMKRIWSEQFKFIVFQREGHELVPESAWYDAFLVHADNYLDDGVSSTKIRNGETQSKI